MRSKPLQLQRCCVAASRGLKSSEVVLADKAALLQSRSGRRRAKKFSRTMIGSLLKLQNTRTMKRSIKITS
jgi:hypothetical protein